MIAPTSPLVAAAERARPHSGRTITTVLLPGVDTIDLGGQTVETWAYNRTLPGPEIRAKVGDELAITVYNGLPDPTTVHWHGIRIRNDMDGVPGMTEDPIQPDGSFLYRFSVPDPGTHWYHSHVGVQRDRGLYGPLIVDDPDDPGDYDADYTVMIDDWLDGLGYTPDQVLSRLLAGTDTGITAPAMDITSPWGPMMGDVEYPYHLINGRAPSDPVTWTAQPGQRLRLRLINASADTDYRVALGGHQLTVTHADGWPVNGVTVDTLLISKGERYDVTVTAGDGVFPLVASAEGKGKLARALLRTASGTVPSPEVLPTELHGQLLAYSDLSPSKGAQLPAQNPDRTVQLILGRDMSVPYRWTINGLAAPDTTPITIHPDERLRIRYINGTTMAHPMHLHGHTFGLVGPAGAGVRKDTVVVLPGQLSVIDVQGDNPGQWMLHCHDEYHLNAGMMTTLSYRT